MSLSSVLYIGAGGFLGTVLRHLLIVLVQPWQPFSGLAVMMVNILGCLAMGVLMGCGHLMGADLAIKIVGIGILGGFTTYSAFGAETLLLFQESRWIAAGLYIGMMNIFCLAACFGGYSLATRYFS